MVAGRASAIGGSVVQEKTLKKSAHSQKMKASKEEKIEDWTKRPIDWPRFFLVLLVNFHMIYSAFFFFSLKWQTIIWTIVWHQFGMTGMTAGAHRLWTHRSYKAKLPLRIFLMFAYSALGFLLHPMFMWIRNHRVHHKFTDTDVDPHNAKQGFFYSHFAWLTLKMSPQTSQALKTIEMTDILEDPVVMFEKRMNMPLTSVVCFLIPIAGPVWLWQESLMLSYHATMFRWGMMLNSASNVNSITHLWGWRPFNKNILASEHVLVSFFACGEGWHNFHHMFPWDYKAADTGFLNTNMHFIKLCERLGLATDLKTASPELVRNVVMKYGDGSHAASNEFIREIPVEALDDPSFLATLPTPEFNKHR